MMKAKIYIPLLLLLAVVFVIVYREWREPEDRSVEWAEKGRWFKGNTHTHSLWSDGNDLPEMIVDWYKNEGYDFLALSDHNTLSRGQRWMPVKQVDKRRQK